MTSRSKRSNAFAVCVDNTGYLASLQAGKFYQVVPDQKAEKHGLLRVIDDTGEDYGYSTERFVILALPHALARALADMSPAKHRDPALRSRGASTAKVPVRKLPSSNKNIMRREYDFSNGVRGKHATQYAEGTKVVIVKPDSRRAR